METEPGQNGAALLIRKRLTPTVVVNVASRYIESKG